MRETAVTTTGAARRHVPALDGVRGLAILLVVVHNLRIEVTAPNRASQLVWDVLTLGWVGVTLFFALSGYLITTILLETRDDPHYWRNFFARRALRIFPLYYVTLLVVCVLFPRLIAGPSWLVEQTSHHQIWFWVYLSNWVIPLGWNMPILDHFWSLAVEEQFYLAWPFVVRALVDRRLGILCFALALISLATRIGLHATGVTDTPMNYYWTVARFDALALGALLAILARHARTAPLLDRWLPRASAWVAGALVLMTIVSKGLPRHQPVVDTAGYSLLALGSALLVGLALPGPGTPRARARQLFESPTLRWLGRYSYGIYVIHASLDEVARRTLPPRWLEPHGAASYLAVAAAYLIGVGGISLLMAYASYHLIEKRFLALKVYFVPAERPAR